MYPTFMSVRIELISDVLNLSFSQHAGILLSANRDAETRMQPYY